MLRSGPMSKLVLSRVKSPVLSMASVLAVPAPENWAPFRGMPKNAQPAGAGDSRGRRG